jgi:hypothetical protein
MYNMPVFSVVPIDKWRYGWSSSAHWELHCRIQLRHLRYRSCHVDSTTQHKTLNLEELHFWSLLRTEHAYVFNPVCTFYIYRIYSRKFCPHVFFAPQIFKHFGRAFFPRISRPSILHLGQSTWYHIHTAEVSSLSLLLSFRNVGFQLFSSER